MLPQSNSGASANRCRQRIEMSVGSTRLIFSMCLVVGAATVGVMDAVVAPQPYYFE